MLTCNIQESRGLMDATDLVGVKPGLPFFPTRLSARYQISVKQPRRLSRVVSGQNGKKLAYPCA